MRQREEENGRQNEEAVEEGNEACIVTRTITSN